MPGKSLRGRLSFCGTYGRPCKASWEPLDGLQEPPRAFGPFRHRAWIVAQRSLQCSLGSRRTPLGDFWAAVLKPLGEPFGGLLGSFWGLLGASLGPLGGLLGPSWGLLGPSRSGKYSFRSIGRPLGPLLGGRPLGPLLGPSSSPLAPPRAPLGPSWGPPGPSWGCPGGLPGCPGALLRASCAVLERRSAKKARKRKTSKNTMEIQ